MDSPDELHSMRARGASVAAEHCTQQSSVQLTPHHSNRRRPAWQCHGRSRWACCTRAMTRQSGINVGADYLVAVPAQIQHAQRAQRALRYPPLRLTCKAQRVDPCQFRAASGCKGAAGTRKQRGQKHEVAVQPGAAAARQSGSPRCHRSTFIRVPQSSPVQPAGQRHQPRVASHTPTNVQFHRQLRLPSGGGRQAMGRCRRKGPHHSPLVKAQRRLISFSGTGFQPVRSTASAAAPAPPLTAAAAKEDTSVVTTARRTSVMVAVALRRATASRDIQPRTTPALK